MNYKIIKIYNHNVVMAAEENGKQVVIIAKGIGFGKKIGEVINEIGDDRKVFYILDENADAAEITQLSHDLEQVKNITYEIVEYAAAKLSIHNDKLYDALLDHISFAIQRLKLGIPIENPFINEITILYSKEFEVAQQAAKLIKERLYMEIGDDEKGFIALHLYSAKKSRQVKSTMKSTRVYKQIMINIGHRFDKPIDWSSSGCKSFLLSLDRMARASSHNVVVEMPAKQYIKALMVSYYKEAEEIAFYIKEELGIEFSDEAKAFLAINISEFIQF